MSTTTGKRTAKVKLTLTKRTVENLQPADKPWIAWDDRLIGFGVRVQPSGAKSFIINYRTGSGGRRVPLSTGALAVLREARRVVDGSDLVFPSVRGRALSDATISKMVRGLGIGAVPHGFRSSFRDWAAECSDAPREVCELALAQVNSDRVEAAYRRTDLFERRRELMQEWSAFLDRVCHPPG